MSSSKILQYIWLDSVGRFRNKIRVEDAANSPPDWNYDGSSTGQAVGHDSDIILRPRCVFVNPLFSHPASLVVCDTYDKNGQPLPNNHRAKAAALFDELKHEEPWFGLEQEYFLIDRKTGRPLGFPANVRENPEPQGKYYCSIFNKGRAIAEEHLEACLKANIKIAGINQEVCLGQHEFQLGVCAGIEAGDHMMAARFLLECIADKHGVDVDLSPKPIKGDWNGSGCHINFSSKRTRCGADGLSGLDHIKIAMERLEARHLEHMEVYGEGNSERLTGHHETARYDQFSWGVADRGASVRIGRDTIEKGYGYFEDRRAAANIDGYLATAKLFSTVIDRDY